MSSERVSCVIPSYNAGRFLRSALESVYAQTHPPFEIIVVDDGSTDGTPEMAQAFAPRVRLVEIPHGGYPKARDAGVAVARGDFIAMLDADDLWVPDKTARQLARFRERPAIDLCVGQYQNFWDDEVRNEEAMYRDHPLSQPCGGYPVPTLLARRDTFARIGPFDHEQHPSDIGWFMRAIAHGAVVEQMPDVLLHRRLHRDNSSRSATGPGDAIFHFIQARRRSRSQAEG